MELEVCLRLSHMDAILKMHRAALLVSSQMRPHTTSGLRSRKLHSRSAICTLRASTRKLDGGAKKNVGTATMMRMLRTKALVRGWMIFLE